MKQEDIYKLCNEKGGHLTLRPENFRYKERRYKIEDVITTLKSYLVRTSIKTPWPQRDVTPVQLCNEVGCYNATHYTLVLKCYIQEAKKICKQKISQRRKYEILRSNEYLATHVVGSRKVLTSGNIKYHRYGEHWLPANGEGVQRNTTCGLSMCCNPEHQVETEEDI